MRTVEKLSLGKRVEVELVANGDSVLGLGKVWADGIQLRDGEFPLRWRIATPEGHIYTRFVKESIRPEADGGICVVLRAFAFPFGWNDLHDEYNMPILTPDMPADEVEDKLELILKPVERSLVGKEWVGFSYSLRFASDAREIHSISLFSTWEIGGSITGNTLYHQGQVCMPVYKGSKEKMFTTTCLKQLHRYRDPQGVSYQVGPRGGINQTFDLLCSNQGSLFLYWPDFDDIKCLVDSPKGSDLLHIVDEYRFELGKNATISPKEAIFCKGNLPEHERRDLWWDLFTLVNGGIRKKFGVEDTVIRPELYYAFSTRADGNVAKTRVGDQIVDPQEALYAYADTILPKLAEAGCRRTLPEAITESDVTALGMKRKLDNGNHGDLLCASVCGTQRFFPSDFYGGIKAWRYASDKARSLGIELGHWFAPHFSPRAPIFQEHPEYMLLEKDSLGFGGGYRAMINTADWRSGIYQWVLDDLRRWREEGGLDYLWVDSWANLSSLSCNYADKMRTNWEPLGRLLGDIQTLGIKSFGFEGISPFGPSRFGTFDPRGDILDVSKGIAGQNDFGWWVGNEDMLYNINMMVQPRMREPQELLDIQFKALASRGFIFYQAQIFQGSADAASLSAESAANNRAYDEVCQRMQTRRMLPDDLGVRWEDGDTQIVFACKPLQLTAQAGAAIRSVKGGGLKQSGDICAVDRHTILEIKNGGKLTITAAKA